MPLTPGSSRSVISHNISEMVAAGHPQKQAVAAALHNADKGKDPPMKKPKTQKVSLGKKGSFSIRPGALHRALGVPEGEKLGQAKIGAALHSKSPSIRRMARSAKGLTAMHHGGK